MHFNLLMCLVQPSAQQAMECQLDVVATVGL